MFAVFKIIHLFIPPNAGWSGTHSEKKNSEEKKKKK